MKVMSLWEYIKLGYDQYFPRFVTEYIPGWDCDKAEGLPPIAELFKREPDVILRMRYFNFFGKPLCMKTEIRTRN
jgi:hypothetical protein